MAEGPASFWTQADALLRKNLIFQKRNMKANIRLIVIPVLLVMILRGLKTATNTVGKQTTSKCHCDCSSADNAYKCDIKCDDGNKDYWQTSCPVTNPLSELPMIRIPNAVSRAVRSNIFMSNDFPEKTCRSKGTCPVVVLLTGNNASIGKGLGNLIFSSYTLKASDPDSSLVNNVLGSGADINSNDEHIYQVKSHCGLKGSYSAPVFAGNDNSLSSYLRCVQGLTLWRNSSLEVNDILYKGYSKGNLQGDVNEILAAYDFSNSHNNHFDVTIQYNATLSMTEVVSGWLPRLLNMISKAYIQYLKGPGTRMVFKFVKDMPKPAQSAPTIQFDLASMYGSLFYSWVALLLFPVVLGSLVYEKQGKLRIMMKIHGLRDGPYWMISYAYFLLTSMVYFFALVAFGSVIDLEFFKLNSYSVQFVFYFIYANLQISWAFLLAAFFSRVKTATVLGYILFFATGLLGSALFDPLTQSISKHWILMMELYPGFSLYRGLGEFGSYAGAGKGLMWDLVVNGNSAMKEVLIIMIYEWFGMLFVAYYVDQIGSAGSGFPKSPFSFMKNFTNNPILQRQHSREPGKLEKPDVQQEVEKVKQLLHEQNLSYSIIVDNLIKIYQGKDGNPEKHAVKGLSLAIPSGECFGMLGPNGAGKTSFISMMIGLSSPTSGTAYVEKMNIRTQIDSMYTKIGVCPQHDLLWETLTGREHLLFYGRLKNLKGAALHQAVEDSLKGLNLFQGGVGDKPVGKYSGGMKRRLSVAISLIGDPKVVYMDEPSTGMDPASRISLWNVVKRAKQGRAIILTTHSMEEAEYLCDRLGIFVDGSLQCVGNPKELKARYGGTYIFTMTTPSKHETEVERLVTVLSPKAKRVYHLSGTQKFELPKHEVNLVDVFSAVEDAKRQFTVQAWGISDTTLEDVFIKVARGAEIFNEDPS